MPPDEAWDGALEQPRPEKSIIVRNDDGTWKPPSNHSDSPNEEAWDGALESMVVDNDDDDDDGTWQPPSNHSDSPNEEAWDGELEQPPAKSIIVSNDDGDDDGTWQPSSNHSDSPHDNEESRDYKRHRLQDNNGAENSKTKKKKKAKSTEAEDMNWVCAECKEAECLMDDPNAHVLVYCDGDCHRVFHLPCAGLSQVPCEDEDWICKDCTKSCHQCPFCKEYGQDNVDVFACRKDECGRFFHKSCLASNNVSFKMVEEQAFSTGSVSPRSVEEDVISTTCVVPSFVCPAHHCWTCTQKDALEKEQKEDEAEKKRGKKKQTSIYQCRKDGRLHRCLYCPSAYHVDCLPPTIKVNELAILCPEHSMTKKLPDLDPSTSVQAEVEDKIDRRILKLCGQASFCRQLPSGLAGGRRGGIVEEEALPLPFCVPADILAAVYSRPAGNNRNKKAKFGVPQKKREPPARKSRVAKKKSFSCALGAKMPAKISHAKVTPKAKAKGRSAPQKNRKPSAKKGLVVKTSLKDCMDKEGRSRPLLAGKLAKKRSPAKATPNANAKVRSVPQKNRKPSAKKGLVVKTSLKDCMDKEGRSRPLLAGKLAKKRSPAKATPNANAKVRSVPQKNRKPSAKKGLVVKTSLKDCMDKEGRSRPLLAGKPAKKQSHAKATPKAKAKVKSVPHKDRERRPAKKSCLKDCMNKGSRSLPLPAGKPAKKLSHAKATPKAKAKFKSVPQKDRPAKKTRVVKKSLKACPLGAGKPARGFHGKLTPNARVSPNQENAVERIVATIQTYDANTKRWSSRDTLFSAPTSSQGAGKCLEKKLHRGGTIKIYPSMLSETELTDVSNDLLSDEGAGFFRQYRIQGDDEPRCHFHMHKHATPNFEDPQPGYAYMGKQIKMKSIPLANFGGVAKVSQRMAETCDVAEWTTGVHAVLYRDSKDKMGFHADNDQGEQLILAAVIKMPTRQIRVVRVRPAQGVELQHGDEDIELFLEAGDGYSMDGEMQKHYFHGVADARGPKRRVLTTAEPQTPKPTRSSDAAPITPSPIAMGNSFTGAAVGGSETQRAMPRGSEVNAEAEDDRRLVLVFRKGKKVVFKNDTGVACDTLAPRKGRNNRFGQIPGLDEGKCYIRYEMLTLNGHIMAQRGISGNKDFGCDAMIVSGKRPDNLGHDELFKLEYFVEQSKGALAVVKSYELGKPIRVFRPEDSKYHELQAIGPHPKFGITTCYRYDGLYYVTDKKEPKEEDGPWEFQLERSSSENKISNYSYFEHCSALGTMKEEAKIFYQPAPEENNVTDKKEPKEEDGPWEFQLERSSSENKISNDSCFEHCFALGTRKEEAEIFYQPAPEENNVTIYEV